MKTRRNFLSQSAGATALGALGGAVTEAQAAIPICDTHQHLWDLTKFKLPWTGSVPALNKSFVTKDYLEATRGLGVTKTIYMEVDVEAAQQVAEAEYVTGLCKERGNPMHAAVIAGRPASSDLRAYLDRFKNNPFIKGVRQVIHVPSTPAGYCLQPDFIKGVRLLGERGLSFDICIRSAELKDAAKLVDASPDTRFILDHCGNPMVKNHDRGQSDEHKRWADDLHAVAQRKHVVCKVSGILDKANPGWTVDDLGPIVLHVLRSFGPNRVMFGGDWPVVTLGGTFQSWVDAVRWIVRDASLAEQRKLFHDNAVGFYGLKEKK